MNADAQNEFHCNECRVKSIWLDWKSIIPGIGWKGCIRISPDFLHSVLSFSCLSICCLCVLYLWLVCVMCLQFFVHLFFYICIMSLWGHQGAFTYLGPHCWDDRSWISVYVIVCGAYYFFCFVFLQQCYFSIITTV